MKRQETHQEQQQADQVVVVEIVGDVDELDAGEDEEERDDGNAIGKAQRDECGERRHHRVDDRHPGVSAALSKRPPRTRCFPARHGTGLVARRYALVAAPSSCDPHGHVA